LADTAIEEDLLDVILEGYTNPFLIDIMVIKGHKQDIASQQI
jgi:hypothetical protein